jgi:hypothetical protein
MSHHHHHAPAVAPAHPAIELAHRLSEAINRCGTSPELTAASALCGLLFAQVRELIDKQASNASAPTIDLRLDEDEADMLRQTIGLDGDACAVRLHIGAGHSGRGVYVSADDYPEEGSVLLKSLPA